MILIRNNRIVKMIIIVKTKLTKPWSIQNSGCKAGKYGGIESDRSTDSFSEGICCRIAGGFRDGNNGT